MSLTRNLQMTGRAASQHLAEVRSDIYEQARKAQTQFHDAFLRAEVDLRDLMGDKFNDWWDGYPETMTKGDFLPIMQAKIAELQSEPSAVDAALEPERSESAELAATMELVGVEDTFTAHLTPNLQLLIASGAVDANGNLKPYRIKDGHRGTPMTIEELGDDGQQYPY